ncbi:flavoprotein [Nocardiopsis mangrovi]|uniref:Flavoprotein n=1 Tax=Nocardiopsis mangrovi TaxID=1179818 RepID=A0ABV9E2T3_9ACTN
MPDLGFTRLLFVVTGAVAASATPGWLSWLRGAAPGLEVKVVMTRSAGRFVTPAALATATGGEVIADEWADGTHDAVHARLGEWAQAAVVFPATLNFMARFSLGLADTPALLSLQCTAAPVAIAPSLPPGAVQGHAYREHWARLVDRPGIVMVPPLDGTSATTGRTHMGGAGALDDVLRRLEERRALLAADAPDPADRGAVEAFGTALRRTAIRRAPGDAFVWTHRPGPLLPAGFTPADPALADAVADAPGPVRFAFGGADPTRRDYTVPGRDSVAGLLIENGPDTGLDGLLNGLGAALRHLHDNAPVPRTGSAPPGLARLERWLAGRAAIPEAAAAERLLRGTMGEKAWAALRSWTAEELEAADPVRVHGAPMLGTLVPDGDRASAALLTGADLGTAARAYDLGFVLGELIEMRWRHGGEAGAWQRLADALEEGYGAELGAAAHRAATLRIALHVHDYTASATWDPGEITRYGAFLTVLAGL